MLLRAENIMSIVSNFYKIKCSDLMNAGKAGRGLDPSCHRARMMCIGFMTALLGYTVEKAYSKLGYNGSGGENAKMVRIARMDDDYQKIQDIIFKYLQDARQINYVYGRTKKDA